MPTWSPELRGRECDCGKRIQPTRSGSLALWMAFAALTVGCGQRDSTARLAPALPPTAAMTRSVNVYNWADNIDPDVIADFEKTTGIKVVYNTYDTQELMETRMLVGSSGFDVVDVASYSLDRLVPAGVFRKLDRQLLPGLGNLDPDLMKSLAEFDPGNEHAVGYMWGTTAIGYNARALRKLAPDAPTDSWRLIYDPRVLAKLAHCGVSFTDARPEIIGTALLYVGADVNHAAALDLAAAARVLGAIRPYVGKIHGESQISDLSSGAMCLMITAGTNVAIARIRAREAGLDADLRYVIPKEGTISWFDTLAIPVDAPHPSEAYAFLDFMMHPDVAAKNANYVGSTTFNRAAVPLVNAALRDDRMLYPDAEIRARLRPLHARSNEASRAEARIWTRFETARM